jgi:comEA protein
MKDTVRFAILPAAGILLAILSFNLFYSDAFAGWKEIPVSANAKADNLTSSTIILPEQGASGITAESTADQGQSAAENQAGNPAKETADPIKTTPGAINKININTATAEELVTLPMIGEVRAASIIDYRTKNGPFRTIEDIISVKGIGEKTFAKIKDAICIE